MDFNFQKIVQILAYLCTKEWDKINYTKALKIIFFSDKLFLRRFWRTITADNYSALKHWPVASKTFDLVKSPEEYDENYIQSYFIRDGYDIKKVSNPDLEFLAKKEIETIDEIYALFWSLNYSQLIEKTHQYDEWKIHEEFVKHGRGSRTMCIEDLFKNSFRQDSIFNMPQEEIDMAREIYSENLSYA